MTRTTYRQQRPRTMICPQCGQRVGLARCGVDEHLKTRTRREQIEGRCTGYVYIHEVNGGIECDEEAAR